jgi:hypothetical protein
MRNFIILFIALIAGHSATAQIDSAQYNASDGSFIIYGSGFSPGNLVYPDSITITGLNGVSYVLTSATPSVTPANAGRVNLSISGIDRAFMNALFDNDGRTSSLAEYYLFDVADGWNGATSTAEINDTITVSNYAPPSILSATYDAVTGVLTVTGDRFASNATAADDIDPSKLTIVGEGGTGSAVILNSTAGVEVTSHDEFSITLTDPDKSSVDGILHINGTVSEDATDYNIQGAEDWNTASNGTDADGGLNAITVSNVPLIVNAIVNDNEICEGEGINLEAIVTGGDGLSSYGFSWTSSATTFTSAIYNPTDNPSITTTYTVEVTGGGTETANVTVTVHPTPTLTSTVISNPICSGSEFIYVPASNEDVTTFSWSRAPTPGISEPANSSTGNIVETLTNIGTTLISVNYTIDMVTTQTCTNTEIVTIDVNAPANVDAISDIKDCEGNLISEIVFTTQSTDGSTSFDWENDNTNVGLLTSTGTGNITAFTAANSGTEPEIANITVTPKYTNGGKTCTGPTEEFQIIVNPKGQVNAITDQVLCHNTNSTYVNFTTSNTVGNTTYSWNNSETGIGLGATGSDDIGAFTATNTGTSQLTANISVTPTFTYNTKSCDGPPINFSYTVNPTAQVDPIIDQKICEGDNIAAVSFSTTNIDGTTDYSWTNNNLNIGLAAAGTSDITSIVSSNGTGQPQLATITVTPEYTNSGLTCSGNSESFTILVNPNGQVNPIGNQILCEGSQTSYINFETTNTIGSTAFNWNNNNTSIGLPANGTGDIPSFTIQNGGTTSITSTIQVTPQFVYNSKTCDGTPQNFSLTSNPGAQADPIPDLVLCNGEATGNISFTTSNTDGTTTYTWTNTNTSIGLAAGGSGDIVSFNAINTDNAPIIATITVTPTYDNNGESCSGSPETFTITVNPDANVQPVSDVTVCHERKVSGFTFNTTNTVGVTTYAWSNDQGTIGIPLSGTGSISSFIASNTSQSQIIANLAVDPTFTYAGKSCPGTSENFNITVNPKPIVDFTMPQTTYSNDAPADTIKGAIPYGGTFYGPGVIAIDSTFHPTSAGIGDHTISYVGWNIYGCKDTATASVSVVPPGGAITGLEAYYCDYALPDTIRGRPDTGGTLDSANCGFTPTTGLIIINDSVAVVDPSVMSGTNVQIEFTYYKGAYFNVTNTTTIHEVEGSADFIGLPPGICVNEDAVSLAGSPGGGTFLGNGISGSEFNPLTAGIGIHDISYTYTLGATGCRDTAIKTVEVYSLTPTTFDVDSLHCSNSSPIQIIGVPATGYFTGPNLSGTDTVLFSPNSSIVGPNTITYTYTNSNGCVSKHSEDIRVTQVATVGIQAINDNYCVNADSVLLRGEVLGVFEGVGDFSGIGVNNNSIDDGIGYFRPDLAGEGGPYQVTYTYTDNNGCVSTFSKNILVRELPNVSISNLDPLYCVNSPSSTISGIPLGASGSFSYSGNQLDLNDLNNGTALFTPTATTPSDTITYTYTDTYGCTNSFKQSVEVAKLPIVGFDSDSVFCPNGDPVKIIGEPLGGYFTGPNLLGSDTVTFSPSASIIGTNTIEYTYTDGNGCTNTFERDIEVTQLTTIGIQPINDSYCVNGDSVLLKGEILGAFEGVGNFSGIGVHNNIDNDGIGYFRPDLAGIGGPYQITFTYVDSNSCQSTFSRNVIVRDLPNVSINNLDELYCVNSPSQSISGVPLGASGSFSYSGNVTDLNDLNDGTALFTPTEVTASDFITYTYTDAYGCTNSYSQELEVADLPVVSFETETLFCPNGSATQIIGVPAGGYFTGPNISGTDTIIFTPSEGIIGTHDLVYTYTDENSCTNSFTQEIEVQELPTVGISGLSSSYCINGDSALLSATVNGTITSDGSFSGTGIFDELPDDGNAYFIPSEAGVGGPFTITYTYTGSNSCVAIAESFVLVRDLPTVSISTPANLFCENDPATTITGIPQSANGSFAYNGVISNLIDLGDGTAQFYPNNVISNGEITYTFSDQYGCTNSHTETVKVSALPDVQFSMSSYCIGETILFTNETVSPEPVISWNWNFGDPTSGNNTSNQFSPTHLYTSSGDKTISLTAITNDGCNNEEVKEVELGDAPLVNFNWQNECFGSTPIVFINSSGNVSSVNWNFGDGGTSSQVNPSHMFNSPDNYDVTLNVTNQFGCSNEITKTITVRPVINQFPYLDEFESAENTWTIDIDSENSSWELGTPNGSVINSAFSGSNSWVTGLVNNYQNNEKSSISSPCYDFTGKERPMIKMQIWSSTQLNNDGAVLQAKIDGTTNWFNIGDLNDVINWYNGVGLQGNPGGAQNVGSYGWTGIENQWKEVRHELDNFKEDKNVRFRISFGSDGSGTSDGFAVDDIWIGERTKRVLAESFTNSTDNACASANPGFNWHMDYYASDVVDIQYHTGFPGTDPFNLANPADVAARTAYYGLWEVPWTIYDGNIYSGTTSNAIDNFILVEEQSLLDPVFMIDLETASSGNQLSININVTANEALSGKNLTLHTVIIESEVTSIVGENGETEFFSVLRDMLPNAGGTALNASWSINETESYGFTWDYNNVIDPDKVNVVVFIQDEDTKRVYQVNTDDPSTSHTSNPEVVLHFENKPFMLYPNPTRDKTNILFQQQTKYEGHISIFDLTGNLAAKHQLNNGITSKEIDISNLKQGIYLIHITSGNKLIGTQRLVKL